MAPVQLYLRVGDRISGPFPSGQVREYARNGKISPSHEGSVDGQTWFLLETIWANLISVSSGDSKASPRSRASQSPAPPPLPRGPLRAEVADSVGRPQSSFDNLQNKTEASRFAEAVPAAVTGHKPWQDDSSQAASNFPMSSAKPSTSYAPSYVATLFGVLRVLLLFAGLVYLLIALVASWIIISVTTLSGSTFSGLWFLLRTQGNLILSVIVLEVLISIFWLCWLHHVVLRLRGFHSHLWSEPFSSWATGFFIPFVTLFTTSKLQCRVWFASISGRRIGVVPESKPGTVLWGMGLRGFVWASYIPLIIAFVWCVDLNTKFSKSIGLAMAVSLSGGIGTNERQLTEAARTAGLIVLGLGFVTAMVSAAVVLAQLLYADQVHRNMLAHRNAD